MALSPILDTRTILIVLYQIRMLSILVEMLSIFETHTQTPIQTRTSKRNGKKALET